MSRNSKHVSRAVAIPMIAIGIVASLCSCSQNRTAVSREVGARPRIEQLALSTAMDDAYGKVDFKFVAERSVFTMTKALSKTDVDFINSYVQKKILAAGGTPVLEEKDAELKLTNTIEVSGTDEVKKRRRGVLIGQFKGTLSVVDLTSGQITDIFDLDSTVKAKRTQKGKTKVIN
jgi:hypothetical protein